MHIHEWSPLSSHTTSEGQVVYVRCPCGAHSVELTPRPGPAAARTVATLERLATPPSAGERR